MPVEVVGVTVGIEGERTPHAARTLLAPSAASPVAPTVRSLRREMICDAFPAE